MSFRDNLRQLGDNIREAGSTLAAKLDAHETELIDRIADTGPGQPFAPVDLGANQPRVSQVPFYGITDQPSQIIVAAQSSVLVTLQLTGIMRLRDGSVVSMGVNGLGAQGIVQGNRNVNLNACQLDVPAGAEPIAVQLVTLGGLIVEGFTYAKIQRTFYLPDKTPIVSQILVQNYVGDFKPVFWPGGPSRSSLEGDVALQLISIANPPAGTLWSKQVPLGAQWEPVMIRWTSTQDGVGGPRTPVLQVGFSLWMVAAAGATVPSGTGYSIQFARGAQFTADNSFGIINAPLPEDIRLGPLGQFAGTSEGLDPGDLLSGIQMYVYERLMFQS